MLKVTEGAGSLQGGVDITISLTPQEAAALGEIDRDQLGDRLDTLFFALALLRTGRVCRGDNTGAPATVANWQLVINDLDKHLIPQLTGARDASVRAHAAAGGSVGQLGIAMDVPRSTAQSRRETLQAKVRSPYEHWATGDTRQN
ncbi:hypothetical protein ACIRPK_34055 [Kitasatospora sp. NPDC101801]|uniref:hypothetical protein n=1 Tax=Kitasatospora sp. NPDC101801 TaxID=3364103 RepID=UPI0038196761